MSVTELSPLARERARIADEWGLKFCACGEACIPKNSVIGVCAECLAKALARNIVRIGLGDLSVSEDRAQSEPELTPDEEHAWRIEYIRKNLDAIPEGALFTTNDRKSHRLVDFIKTNKREIKASYSLSRAIVYAIDRAMEGKATTQGAAA